MRIETHVHTRYSKDSLLCFWMLYLKCRFKRIECIAITEHNNILGGIAFREYCNKRGNKISVIVGEEVFTNCGEIIGLYLSEEIPPGLSPEETIERIKEQEGVVYIPHPYDLKRSKTVLSEEAIACNKEKIDCIEVHNGRNISEEYDLKQNEIRLKYDLVPVIGSDSHILIEIGRNYMELSCAKAPKNALEFVREIQTAQFHTEICMKSSHTITKFCKAFKLLSKGNFNELYKHFYKRTQKNKSKMGG